MSRVKAYVHNDGEEKGEVVQLVDNQVKPSPIQEIVAQTAIT